MRKLLTMTTVLAGLSLAGIAAAEDRDCTAPMVNWQPRQAVQKMAEEKGWTVRRIKTDDGCYEIKGHDAKGRRIEAKVDPATLAVVEMEYEDGDDDDEGRNAAKAAPAGTVAPPENGLFKKGGAGVVVK